MLDKLKNAAGKIPGVKDAIEGVSDAAENAGKSAAGVGKEVKSIAGSALHGDIVNENTRNEMFKKIMALIPGQVDNNVVVNAFEIMRKEQKLIKSNFEDNIKSNEECFKKHLDSIMKNKGYIEDQNNYPDMKYGQSTMKFSGCEIFATFNALFNIRGNHEFSLSKMISEYEKDGMVYSGKFGTAPKAISDFLKKLGFETKMSTSENEFDSVGENADSLILTMYNDRNDISKEVHTVNISKEKGKYTAHNVYCNGKSVGPYASVSEVIKNINGGKAKGISLIGIRKPR